MIDLRTCMPVRSKMQLVSFHWICQLGLVTILCSRRLDDNYLCNYPVPFSIKPLTYPYFCLELLLTRLYRRQGYNKVFWFNFGFYKQNTCKKDFSIVFGNMPRRMVDAAEVKPGDRGWTCIVQVIERHPILYKTVATHPFQKRFRNFLLTDMKGTKMKAVMFDNDIDFHERSLHPFKRYKISNATVTLPAEKYQLPDYKFSWTITSRTPVEPILDSTPYILPCNFQVCKFADIHKFAEADTNISIRGLVVHQFPVLDISNTKCIKDYVVVNEEEIPIVLRLWKDLLANYDPNVENFHKEPVTIIASNLAVKTFHGLSLATRTNTYMIQNPPPLPEDLCLKKWYSENKQKVDGWLKDKAYEDIKRFFVPPKPEEILDLTAAMTAFQQSKTCWIRAKVRLSVTRYPLYYIVCGNCGITVEAGLDWDVECSGCELLSAMEIRLKLPVTLNDENTNMRSTIKSPDAEKLIPFAPAEVMKLQEQGHSVMDDISIAMDNTEVVCFVKYYDTPMNDTTLRRYVVLKTYTLEEMEAFTTDKTVAQNDPQMLSSTTAAAVSQAIPLLSPDSTKTATSQAEFFTPTTKQILDEVSQECVHLPSTTSQSPAAKRSISFGTITKDDLEHANLEASDSNPSDPAGTPKKKNKGPEKNVQED